jgi:predicted DNA-binding transcriptional regulator AlpA
MAQLKKGGSTVKTTKTASLPETLHPEQRLKLREVATLVGVHGSTIHLWIKQGKFMAPERYGTKCARWRAGDVLAHLQARREATA